MARSVTIKSGFKQILLPNGNLYEAGDTVILSDQEWRSLSPGAKSTILTDNGSVADDTDGVTVQGDAVSAPAAVTAADAAGETPTDDEFNAAVADIVALHATVDDLVTNLTGEGKALASA